MNDIIDALEDLSLAIGGMVKRLQDMSDALAAAINEFDTLTKTIDDLREVAEQ